MSYTTRLRFTAIVLLVALMGSLLGANWERAGHAMSLPAPSEGFAATPIGAVWQHDDGQVASGRVQRAWLWGPGPFYTNYEPFADTPQHTHLVQYFDKGRLEVSDPPSAGGVTAGLLVKEMVTGDVEVGGGRLYRLGSASVPVAGDAGNTAAPTYGAFAKLTGKAQNSGSTPVIQQLDAKGQGSTIDKAPMPVTLGHWEEASGHNWADIFWRFATDPNRPASFSWLTTLGYPISEPYWVQAPVAGRNTTLLVQLFERRVLTFNPSNPSAMQVEMGNVGRHYYSWRYADQHQSNPGAKYNVSITVGRAPVRATYVDEIVSLTNTTLHPLSTVVLHAPWRHWDGVLDVQAATMDGVPAQTHWLEGINMEVMLPKQLQPGGHTQLELKLSLRPRPVGGRTGYDRDNDILTLGDMLPTVVPWQNGGWQIYPYSDLGDLGYYLTSDYDVQINSTGGEKLIVGGTGPITSVDKAHTSWHFNASGVRDVAYVISPNFVDPAADASMTRQVGKVQILAYFLPGHRSQAQRQLDLVSPAFDWFSKNIGPYPYNSYTVAEMGVPLEKTDDYAQEYPMSYYIPTNWLNLGTTPGAWTWYTPVHETGHQWFYSALGNNQLTDPWLDEAMTTYVTTEYVRANFPGLYSEAYSSMTSGATGARPVSSGVYSGFINENQYSATVYDGGVQMLNRVRQKMGDTAFYSAVRDYYARFKGSQATPRDLTQTLQAHTSADLEPIFAQYLGF
ncbi:MAG: hypothetical protein M3014_01745 [Chloroflexota bacterium]|nr:hypothetical protein [Chloroflexota bacterium]